MIKEMMFPQIASLAGNYWKHTPTLMEQQSFLLLINLDIIFRCVNATLEVGMSVRPAVHLFVRLLVTFLK